MELKKVRPVFVDGVEIINATPHSVRFLLDNGCLVEVPDSGVVINAKIVESDAGNRGEAKLVKANCTADEVSEEALCYLEAKYPGAIIIGSSIAAQAFPGRVFMMTPAPGFVRVPASEKRMSAKKFTTF